MKRLIPLYILGLTALACSLFSGGSSIPGIPTTVIPVVSATVAPSATATVSSLTANQLKNASYQLAIPDAHPIVKLTDGRYLKGTDPASTDYASIDLTEQMAFGDLNDDGVSDAAVLLAENYGGSGVFVSVIAMLNKDGKPVEAASELVDDRPILNSIVIRDGQIYLDATVHGSNDPGCCAAEHTKRAYRYEANQLVITNFSMTAPDHTERTITINTPVEGADSAWPLTVTGQFTIAPFENNLVYSVYDMAHDKLALGPLTVNAAQPGGPGTFSFPLDLSSKSVAGPIRIQVEDSSAADGSILALASVKVNIK